MYVGALRIELLLREVHSLKEKRGVVKRLMAEVTKTFKVAVAEVDHQDLWQRVALGVAAVSSGAGHLNRRLHTIEQAFRERPGIEVLSVTVSHLEEAS